MKTKNTELIEKAKKELENIEHRKRTWNSKFMRELAIWDEIAMEINSTSGKEHKFWGIVMDLYHEKYK